MPALRTTGTIFALIVADRAQAQVTTVDPLVCEATGDCGAEADPTPPTTAPATGKSLQQPEAQTERYAPATLRPEPGTAEPPKPEAAAPDAPVIFATGSAALAADAVATLERMVEYLRRYPAYKVTVEGHCDERGSREYNLALGARRAEAVAQFLIERGIARDRITTISYGKERPVALGTDGESMAQNRRVVIVVSQ